MSYYLQINADHSEQLASNIGYGDFGEWIDSLPVVDYPQLAHLWEHGWSQDPEAVKDELDAALKKSPPKNSTIKTTANVLATALDDYDGEMNVVTVTDGFGTDASGSKSLSLEYKTEGPHSYSCVMLSIPEPLASKILKFAIPTSDLADDGRENDPHVTVKYGLLTNDSETVADLLRDQPPVKLSLGKVSVFEATPERDSDVVVIDVESEQLVRLNKLICHKLNCVDTNPVYIPHITLAYVKPGTGAKYAGNMTFAGIACESSLIIFSDQQNEKTEITLGESGKSRQAKVRENVKANLIAAGYTPEEADAKIAAKHSNDL